MAKINRIEALNYHEQGRPGKIEVVPTKPHSTQCDLSLAYTPGVAEPCLEIYKNPDDAYKYTAKGNLVAVISNGTAVLGLGDIGPLAGKPVMEGKGLLFKIFADVDVFDIEVNEKDPKKFIEVVKAIAPSFGGINLEDIKAPECFEIEETLKRELDIPVFHDDQHGTAIITSAALMNCLEIVGKDIRKIKVFVSGAGAAGCACTKMFVSIGVTPENIVMSDINGILTKNRNDLSVGNKQFATSRNIHTIEEGIKDADVFLGVSAGGVLTQKMLKTMAENPIVFALANPIPEISYEDAISAREDIIMATGRSDYPNQINNVLGFPYIFRGALDVRATTINEEMKIAASKALASMAKKYVPDMVAKAYNQQNIVFGKDYIIPKPLDHRLITTISVAVAQAAIKSGVARKTIKNWTEYEQELSERLGFDNRLVMSIRQKARQVPKSIVFAEGNNFKILKSAEFVSREKIAKPILLGNEEKIRELIHENHLELEGVPIIDLLKNVSDEKREHFANILYEARKYHLDLILAHQYIGQLITDTSTRVRDAVFGNVGTICLFRVGAEDAEFLEKEFEPVFMAQDLVNLPSYNIYIKLMIDGIAGNAFSAETLPPADLSKTETSAEKVIRITRERYGTQREIVEEKIARWSGMVTEKDLEIDRNTAGIRRDKVETIKNAKTIRAARKPIKSSHPASTDGDRKMYSAKCATCDADIEVPFKPDGSRPTFCKDCLKDYQRQQARVQQVRGNKVGDEKRTAGRENIHPQKTITLREAVRMPPKPFRREKSERPKKKVNLDEVRELIKESLESKK